jgi:hypothetical protein
MWARGADADPMELLREIASGWETSYFDRKNES